MYRAFLLFLASASTLSITPVFYVKMLFVTAAVVTLWLMDKRVFSAGVDEDTLPIQGKVLAVASLSFWTLAIVAGRLVAYLGPSPGF